MRTLRLLPCLTPHKGPTAAEPSHRDPAAGARHESGDFRRSQGSKLRRSARELAHGVSRGKPATLVKPRNGAEQRGGAMFRPLGDFLAHVPFPWLTSRHGLSSSARGLRNPPCVADTHRSPRISSESAISPLSSRAPHPQAPPAYGCTIELSNRYAAPPMGNL